jgi:hypothetical protein
MKSLLTFCVGIALLGVLSPPSARAEPSTNRPFLAIWRDAERVAGQSQPPYLRIAIWEDGRVVYAARTNRWNHDLQEGRISQETLATLKKDLAATGIFDLEGTCYLVIDAPVDCVMVDLGARQQMLFWDEVEKPGYGININPQPHHLSFIRCWKKVNELALAAIPAQSATWAGRFDSVPASWRLKRPIQSK